MNETKARKIIWKRTICIEVSTPGDDDHLFTRCAVRINVPEERGGDVLAGSYGNRIKVDSGEEVLNAIHGDLAVFLAKQVSEWDRMIDESWTCRRAKHETENPAVGPSRPLQDGFRLVEGSSRGVEAFILTSEEAPSPSPGESTPLVVSRMVPVTFLFQEYVVECQHPVESDAWTVQGDRFEGNHDDDSILDRARQAYLAVHEQESEDGWGVVHVEYRCPNGTVHSMLGLPITQNPRVALGGNVSFNE